MTPAKGFQIPDWLLAPALDGTLLPRGSIWKGLSCTQETDATHGHLRTGKCSNLCCESPGRVDRSSQGTLGVGNHTKINLRRSDCKKRRSCARQRNISIGSERPTLPLGF